MPFLSLDAFFQALLSRSEDNKRGKWCFSSRSDTWSFKKDNHAFLSHPVSFIGRFHIMWLPPCWRPITKDSSLASIVCSSNMAAIGILAAISSHSRLLCCLSLLFESESSAKPFIWKLILFPRKLNKSFMWIKLISMWNALH